MKREIYTDVRLGWLDDPMPGFRRQGYVVYSVASKDCYLKSLTEWTDKKSETHVFSSVDTALATAEAWSYFSASTNIKVIVVRT